MTEPAPILPDDKALVKVPKVTWTQYLMEHPVAVWSNHQISDWLIASDLGHLVPVFSKFNGRSFLSLTDKTIDELLGTSNPVIKELGTAYQVADKVNFKYHFEILRGTSPWAYKCCHFVGSVFSQLGPKIQSELVNKISSKTVEAMLAWVALGGAAVVTGYLATTWPKKKKSKKE
jgi:hypothetical protein